MSYVPSTKNSHYPNPPPNCYVLIPPVPNPTKENENSTNIRPQAEKNQSSPQINQNITRSRIVPTQIKNQNWHNNPACQQMVKFYPTTITQLSENIMQQNPSHEKQRKALDDQREPLTESLHMGRKSFPNPSKIIFESLKSHESKLTSLEGQVTSLQNDLRNPSSPRVKEINIFKDKVTSNEKTGKIKNVISVKEILNQNLSQKSTFINIMSLESEEEEIDVFNDYDEPQTLKRARALPIQADKPQKKFKSNLLANESDPELIVDDDDKNLNFFKILRFNIFDGADKPFTFFDTDHRLFYFPNVILGDLNSDYSLLNIEPFHICLPTEYTCIKQEEITISMLSPYNGVTFPSHNIDFTNENGRVLINVSESNFDLRMDSIPTLKANRALLNGSIVNLRITIKDDIYNLPVLNQSSQFFNHDFFNNKDIINKIYDVLKNIKTHAEKAAIDEPEQLNQNNNSNTKHQFNNTDDPWSQIQKNDNTLTQNNETNFDHLFSNIDAYSYNYDDLEIDATFNDALFEELNENHKK